MRSTYKTRNLTLLVAGLLLTIPGAFGKPLPKVDGTPDSVEPAMLQKQVRHELVMLPYLSVFDNLEYSIQGNTVTLSGQVVRGVTKSDAENAVKRVKGVAKVVDNIEVLPASIFDDRIRFAERRAIYSAPSLQRYAMGTLPSIRIVVENGNVTLDGVVANKSDNDIAYLRANGVPGVFSVTNNLRIEKK